MKAFISCMALCSIFFGLHAFGQSIPSNREAAIGWYQKHAIPLNGVEAEQGFDDMQGIKDIVGDARIVALGEATHGTREFFQMKHRMLEFLVTEMGFTIFAIEATMPEAFDINEYVLTGKGDPEKALAGLYFWTWNTEEVLEMIHWMRRYNADESNTRKVKFYGFDMQSPTRPIKVLVHYLSTVDNKMAQELQNHPTLSLLLNPYTVPGYSNASNEEMLDGLHIVLKAARELDANKESYSQRTGHHGWELARLHAQILVQNIRSGLPSEEPFYRTAVRDSGMAANAQWIMEHEGPDAKMVTWAHNAHVAKSEMWMGHHLAEAYGDDMVVFGFSFNQGSFQAMEMPFGTGKGLRSFHVLPLDDESLDASLAAAKIPVGIIDLRLLPDSGAATTWFGSPLKSRSFGAGFSPQYWDNAADYVVTDIYDALIFIEETTAARPNAGGKRPPAQTHSAPINLDFEQSGPGFVPAGWNTDKYQQANFGFTIETSADQANSGDQSIKISRPPGNYYGETFGSISQRIEAKPYLGKRIKLRAAVRAEVQGPGNQAHMTLRVTRSGFGPSAELFADRMEDRPITTQAWTYYEIEGEVPESAEWITIGSALTGEGTAWFDSFSLEINGELTPAEDAPAALAIKETYAQFKNAVINENADSVLKVADSRTVQRYGEWLDTVLHTSEEETRMLDTNDLYYVLAFRHMIPHDALKTMNAESLIRFSIENGFFEKNVFSSANLIEIEVAGTSATSSLSINGFEVPGFNFNKEDSHWKIDLTSLESAESDGIQSEAKRLNKTAHEVIIMYIEQWSGKSMDDSVWQPVNH